MGLVTTEFRAGFMAIKFTVEHDDQPWKPARNHPLEGEDDLSILVDITVYTTVLLVNNA